MSASALPYVHASGQGILFEFTDGTNPSNVTNVADGNELQRVAIGGNPSGGHFALSFGGHTTSNIAVSAVPPINYFQWNFTLASAGTYDLWVNLAPQYNSSSACFYEVIDNATVVGTQTLDRVTLSNNAAPYVDPVLRRQDNSDFVHWYSLGRFTFTTTAGHVRVSCPAVFNADYIACDQLRIETTDGSAVVTRVDSSSPSATWVPGSGTAFRQSSVWAVAGQSIDPAYTECIGTGPRYVADPAVVQSALQALASIGSGNCSVGGPAATGPDGTLTANLDVTFVGSLGGVPQSLLTCGDGAISISETNAGGVLPQIKINGGSPIRLAADWVYWLKTHQNQPFVYFAFPQARPTTYSKAGCYDNTFTENWNGSFGAGYADIPGQPGQTYQITSATATATYHFRPIGIDGQYRVSVTWPAYAGFSTAVTFAVRDLAGNVLGTHTVDQTASPSGATDGGVAWDVIGTYSLTGANNGLTVTQTNGTSTLMVADAVRIERVSGASSIQIQPTDTVTVSWGAGWATCGAGAVADSGGYIPVANKSGGHIYLELPTSTTMAVGVNVNEPISAYPSYAYYNLCKLADGFGGDGSITAINAPSIQVGITTLEPTYRADGRSYASTPNGNYVLMWDGTSAAHPTCTVGTITEYGSPVTGGTDNKRFFTSGPGVGAYGSDLKITVSASGPAVAGVYPYDFRNPRIYPADVDLANVPKFRPDYIARISGMKGIRIDGLTDNRTDYSDYTSTQLSCGLPVRSVTFTGHTISQYTGTTYAGLDTSQGGLVNFHKVGHGLAHGQLVTGYYGGGASSYSAGPTCTMTDDSTFHIFFYTAFVVYVDADNFVLQVGPTDGRQIAGSVTDNTSYINMTVNYGQPLADMVDLCNQANVDFHFNAGAPMTEACMASVAGYVGAHLKHGLKFRVAWHDETWNYGLPGAHWATLISVLNGSTGFVPGTVSESLRLWAAMKPAFIAAGGHAEDFVRLMESQHAVSDFTRQYGQAFHDLGQTFDEMATGPYFNNAPSIFLPFDGEPEFYPNVDRWTPDQDLDLMEAFFTYGGYEQEFADHIAKLVGSPSGSYYYPEHAGVKFITYECGPDTATEAGNSGSWHGPNFGARNHACWRHPRWFGLYQHMMRQHAIGGCTLWQQYAISFSDRGNQGGTGWAAWIQTDSGTYTAGNPTQDAIQINTPDRVDLAKSVSGGALKAFAALYGSPTPPPPATTGINVMRVAGFRHLRFH